MPETKISNKKDTQYKLREPSMYNVIFHNDDVTTMEFVVMVLVRIFRKDEIDAEELMMKVHTEGSAVAGTYSKDIAESKSMYTMVLARRNGYPLKLTTEPA